MHEFDAGGSARMSSSKIWDEHVTNEETKSQWRHANAKALPKNCKEVGR